MNPEAIAACEPTLWVLVFQRESKNRWVRWLACGMYKHVAAYAYLPGFKAWLIFDVNLVRTSVVVVPDDEIGLGYLYDLTKDADLVSMKRQDRSANWSPRSNWLPHSIPLFGWCVPAIKHLIGLRSGALRPDRLFRDCLAAGGQQLEQRHAEVCSAAA